MKTLIVYYTKYGNTQKIAQVIAEQLCQVGDTRLISVDQFTCADCQDVSLVVMGSPTHYQNMPEDVRATLKALPKKALAGKQVAAFDTSLKMWGPIMWLTAAHRILPWLRRLGGKAAVPPQTFLVDQDSKLLDGELERARAWADTIRQHVTLA